MSDQTVNREGMYRWPTAEMREGLIARLPEIREDLAALVAIPSVLDPTTVGEGAPFGRPLREALDLALAQSRRLGLRTFADPSGFFGFAEIGKVSVAGEKGFRIDLPVHLDVVPAPDPREWKSGDPFRLLVQHDPVAGGEVWVGRGAIDDKGPAAMMMHLLGALKAVPLDPAVTVRLVFAMNEESGDWEDMRRYLAREGRPDVALIPDSNFPWLAEQDMLFTTTTGCGKPLPAEIADPNGVRVLSIDTGENAKNCVPAEAVAVVAARDIAALEGLARSMRRAYARSSEAMVARARPQANDAERISLRRKLKPSFVRIGREGKEIRARMVVKGLPHHACESWKGINALQLLAASFEGVRMADTIPARAIAMLQSMTHQGWKPEGTGYFLGIDHKPFETHGAQTFTASVLKADASGMSMIIDNRIRIGMSIEETMEKWRAIAEAHGFEMTAAMSKEGITPPSDHRVLSVMREALRRETGMEPWPRIDGGGTLAREFNDPEDPGQLSIGFGIEPTDGPAMEHQPDEYIAVAAVEAGLRIYGDTLCALAGAGSGFAAARMR